MILICQIAITNSHIHISPLVIYSPLTHMLVWLLIRSRQGISDQSYLSCGLIGCELIRPVLLGLRTNRIVITLTSLVDVCDNCTLITIYKSLAFSHLKKKKINCYSLHLTQILMQNL